MVAAVTGATSSRHPDFPNALTRKRKLPLHALLAVLLSGMRKNIQAELDAFFTDLEQRAQLARHVSERASFSARAKLTTQSYADFSTQMALVLNRKQLSRKDFDDAETMITNMVLSAVALPA